jgi:hypothetical protein
MRMLADIGLIDQGFGKLSPHGQTLLAAMK